ncbi:MAG TPA: hypothetical protein VJ974_02895 [Geopsychrobacteraceae bacterium]|nr:hypothetical protein [Geopsychrobacteraceae bacterium]
MKSSIKKITTISSLFFILILSTPANAVEFDVWKTGMTLSEIVETAKANNIPLAAAGITSKESGFNQKFINERFWSASSVGYLTELLGVSSTVTMRITPEQPKVLYEIEVMMTGAIYNEEFTTELVRIFNQKYGPPGKATGSLKKWTLNDTDQIVLKLFSAPIISYTDLSYREKDEAQNIFRPRNDDNGRVKKDVNRF